MARPRGPNEPSTYQAQPKIPAPLRPRFDLIRAVLGERTTISEAARELSIARVNMQTLVHRAEAAILETLQPRPTGPAPRPPSEKALQDRVDQLEKENAKLKRQLQAADDMMAAAGEIIRSLRGLPPETSRHSSPRSKRSRKTTSDDEPERPRPEPILRAALERLLATNHREQARMARVIGIAAKTLRRWIQRLSAGQPLVRPRGGRMRAGPPEAEQRVRGLVEDLHGLVGAASLARSVEGVSRRRAARIKHEAMTQAERDRRARCATVHVTRPGVVRGFDAMHIPNGFVLTAADASVPFRTTVKHVPTYDAEAVAMVFEEDFQRYQPPLVLRNDRARCHTSSVVASVLRKHGVLLLQGPPYYPAYYGQLERQNAEHRAWCGAMTPDQAELDQMKNAVNERWRRPTLDWRSAAECWESRPPLDDDRDELHAEVHERAARLRAHNVSDDMAMRLAIEQALTQRGYLRVTPGTQTAMRSLHL